MCENNDARTQKAVKSMTSHSSDEEDDLHLSLFPWAHFEVVQQPSFKNCIEVHGGNAVRCSISGREVWVTLDSGLSETVMSKSLALRLGLLKGHEETVKVKVTSLIGTKKFDVVRLSPVVVTFENGQQVCDMALVLHETTPFLPDVSSVVMGLLTLRRCRMMQTFHRQNSTLSIRSPRRVPEPGRFPRNKGVFTFQVLPERPRGHLRMVLLSTAMYSFYCSQRIKCKFELKLGKRSGIENVTLDLGGKHILKRIQLKVLPHMNTDFVMGRQLLHKYEATIDFKRNEMVIPRSDLVSKVSLVLQRL